jgi:hypothetical protein
MSIVDRNTINFTPTVEEMDNFLRRQKQMRQLQEIYWKIDQIHRAFFTEGQPLPKKWRRIYGFRWKLPKFFIALCDDPDFDDDMYEVAFYKMEQLFFYLPEAPSLPEERP